jgi:hypothetical protein
MESRDIQFLVTGGIKHDQSFQRGAIRKVTEKIGFR